MMSRRASVCRLAVLVTLGSAGCTQPVAEAPAGFPSGGPPGRPFPTFQANVSASPAPPPVSGGTLLASANGKWLVASDPDRDAIYVVDRAARTVVSTLPLQPGDEPGRLAEDGAGRVHVVLRGGGALLTLVPGGDAVPLRRPVCPAPRGVAWEKAGDRMHVACAGGELVSLAPAGGPPVRELRLASGLRDVVSGDGATLFVSQFRQAHLFGLDGDGQMVSNRVNERNDFGFPPTPDAALAWRTAAVGPGRIGVLFQTGDPAVATTPGGYGSSRVSLCEAIVQTAFSELGDGQRTGRLALAVLPVDFAVSDGQLAVVAAGNAHLPGVAQVLLYDYEKVFRGGGACVAPDDRFSPRGEATAIVAAGGDLVVQTREPATLQFRSDGGTVQLSSRSRYDTGHAIFHSDSGAGLACASCHGEGGDDGRVWNFGGIGPRRTQALRGGVLQSAPFHWSGDERDLGHLVDDVFVGRMKGPPLGADHVAALGSFIESLPLLPTSPPGDPAAVARGDRLFHDPAVGCAACHGGARGTTAEVVDVGTGGRFKVPSLRGVWNRAPYLHDGSVGTLRDRFNIAFRGDQHGHVDALTAPQLDDLTAYLGTL